jgi:hypothetical protein
MLGAVLRCDPGDESVGVGPHAGLDRARRDGDRAHVCCADLLGDDFRQRVGRGLGHVVVERTGADEARPGEGTLMIVPRRSIRLDSAARLTRTAL